MPISAGDRIVVPRFLPDEQQHRRLMAHAIIEAFQGHLQNTGDVTLANSASASSTTVTDSRVGFNSFIGLMPTTLNAASAMAATYISARSAGGFTISHAINTTADKAFVYCVLG